jgi:nitroimidazol reductase NimA-like FMN-containing flavoprotein (pyridoxamine 5'-phosphate oxidase superfamily)
MILPVNYVASKDAIVFCTLPGTKLSAVGAGVEVVFEVGESNPEYHSGWSVIVRGMAREITDHRKLERLRRGPLRSWAVRSTEHWVEISIDELSGRIISGD